MNIRQRSELKAFAAQRLSNPGQGQKILLIFSGLTLGSALLVTVVNYLLELAIAKTGGLSNMGTRAVLDTLSQILPIAQSVLALCLELGYTAAMLRIARGQYTSPNTLKLGFDRFWPLLRLSILRGLLMMGLGFAAIYVGTMVYIATPLSAPALALLEPVMGTTLDPNMLLEGDLYADLLASMWPCYLICGAVYLVLEVPVWYRYRMAGFVLIDKPAYGAMMALRESRQMLRRNRVALFQLDLSMWYYYLPLFLSGFVSYGDVLLSLVGITLPLPQAVTFFLFYGLYLAAQFAVYFFLRNRVEVTYALAYDSLRPREPEQNGVVLGNIFQM